MIKVKIGPVQKELEDVDPKWVHKMIRSLREAGPPVCVIVTIDEPPINFTLSTKECNRGGSPIANFNEKEQRIIELWRKHLDEDEVGPGHLIAFLSQQGRFVG